MYDTLLTSKVNFNEVMVGYLIPLYMQWVVMSGGGRGGLDDTEFCGIGTLRNSAIVLKNIFYTCSEIWFYLFMKVDNIYTNFIRKIIKQTVAGLKTASRPFEGQAIAEEFISLSEPELSPQPRSTPSRPSVRVTSETSFLPRFQTNILADLMKNGSSLAYNGRDGI